MFDNLRKELRLGAPTTEVSVKFAMDLDLSLVNDKNVKQIAFTLMNFSKNDFNIFYPVLVYNVITSNQGKHCEILLEHLPIYIMSCLAYPEKEYISDYEELKFNVQKYYL